MSLKDVAKKAGVSEATASLVMNNRDGVNSRTRERVKEAANELGYIPNKFARSLATNQNNTLGLVVTDIENPFYSSLTRYVNDIAREKGYSLLISLSHHDQTKESEVLTTLIEQQVAGIIIAPVHTKRTSFDIFQTLKKRNIPAVSVTSYFGYPDEHYVMTDYTEGSYKLTNYLLSMGHRKINHIVIDELDLPINKLRIAGYKKAFAEHNITFDPALILPCNAGTMTNAYLLAKELLQTNPPDAIMTINDIMAIGVTKAARELQIKIPEELSIAGYDDIASATFTFKELTTVRQNIREIAEQSMDMLFNMINKKPVSQEKILLPTELILRESTGINKTP